MATNSIPPSAAATPTSSGPGTIRIVGDPVLTKRADEVDDIDGALVALTSEMLTTMYEAPGLGLAAPQVGVSRRFFVYDLGDGPAVLVNPEIDAVLREDEQESIIDLEKRLKKRITIIAKRDFHVEQYEISI